MSILLGILEEGLIYAILALGVYITYSILDFPDLSVDSTFPLGSAVTAVGCGTSTVGGAACSGGFTSAL